MHVLGFTTYIPKHCDEDPTTRAREPSTVALAAAEREEKGEKPGHGWGMPTVRDLRCTDVIYLLP